MSIIVTLNKGINLLKKLSIFDLGIAYPGGVALGI